MAAAPSKDLSFRPAPPLTMPQPDVLVPLRRVADPAERFVDIGRRRWRLHGVSDVVAEDPHRTECTDRVLARVADAVCGRLDEAVPSWRAGSAGERRPAEVVARRVETAAEAQSALEGFDLLDWLSDRWQSRIDSSRWAFTTSDGATVGPEWLDRYGRSGGIVCFARGAAEIAGRVITREMDPLLRDPVFDGERADWVSAVRNVSTCIIQLGLIAVPEARRVGPNRMIRSPAVDELVRAALAWWHPAAAWHVDVVGLAAQGISVARFAEPHYPTVAPTVLEEVVTALCDAGIRSAPVQLA